MKPQLGEDMAQVRGEGDARDSVGLGGALCRVGQERVRRVATHRLHPQAGHLDRGQVIVGLAAPPMQEAQSPALQTVASVSGCSVTMSERASRPPGANARATAVDTAGLSADRLITFETTASRAPSGTGGFSIALDEPDGRDPHGCAELLGEPFRGSVAGRGEAVQRMGRPFILGSTLRR